MNMNQNELKNWGPLAVLIGKWEGQKGDDTAPADDRGKENNKYRELAVYEAIGPANNHEQKLYGLRYAMTAWPLGKEEPFHEELGYMMWDEADRQIIRCVLIPRGVAIVAGGTAQADSKTFHLTAKVGSHTYGIASNLFLDREFKTMGYEVKYTIHDDQSFSYDQNVQIQIKGQPQLFNHRDGNTLHKIG
jgi:hypothetical protein